MNFLRKKKNEQKDADPEQDCGIRFNTKFDKRFLSFGRLEFRLYVNQLDVAQLLIRYIEMLGQ